MSIRNLTLTSAIFYLTSCGLQTNTQIDSTTSLDQSNYQNTLTSKQLNAWFDQKYEESLLFSPMELTQLGRKEHYDKIDDFSTEAKVEKLEWWLSTCRELKKLINYQALSYLDKTSHDLWLNQCERQSLQYKYHEYQYTFNQMFGSQSYLPTFLINFHNVETIGDMEAYIKRIKGISTAIDQLLSQAKTSANKGIRPPHFAYEGALEESQKLLSGYPFDKDLNNKQALFEDGSNKIKQLLNSKKINEKQAQTLNIDLENQLKESFKPSYKKLISWLKSDIKNTSEKAEGVLTLPNGDQYYQSRLKLMTTTDMSADDIHDLGLEEVQRIRQEMKDIMREVNFKGNLKDFFSFVEKDKTDSRFYFPNNDEGRLAYIELAKSHLNEIESKLPQYFGILPEASLVVKRVEPFRERPGGPQYYFPGTPDGSRPGTYYAHLSDMTTMPKNQLEAIAYHEGNPGHHLQISIAQELENIPTFRTQLHFTSYSEGWALYSEKFAKEMGAYRSPYSDFGRLVTEIWRAIRLVVDTGIHARGWSEEKAIQYFEENAPVPKEKIKAEVRRYFVLPGQATAYKVGMTTFLKLRSHAKTELGENFNIKQFHDIVLGGGAVPLNILENNINHWIKETKAGLQESL